MAPITINGNKFDPDEADHLGINKDNASGSNYIIIQIARGRKLRKDNRIQLGELGVTILEYVSEYTYICRYEPDDLTDIRKKEYVHWANVYPALFVIPPELKPKADSHLLRTEQFVEIVMHKDVDLKDSESR